MGGPPVEDEQLEIKSLHSLPIRDEANGLWTRALGCPFPYCNLMMPLNSSKWGQLKTRPEDEDVFISGHSARWTNKIMNVCSCSDPSVTFVRLLADEGPNVDQRRSVINCKHRRNEMDSYIWAVLFHFQLYRHQVHQTKTLNHVLNDHLCVWIARFSVWTRHCWTDRKNVNQRLGKGTVHLCTKVNVILSFQKVCRFLAVCPTWHFSQGQISVLPPWGKSHLN